MPSKGRRFNPVMNRFSNKKGQQVPYKAYNASVRKGLLYYGTESNKNSPVEDLIFKVIKDLKLPVYREVKFNKCLSDKNVPYRFDFYLPLQNILIEYDGARHEGKYDSEYIIRDRIKNEFATKYGFILKRFNKEHINDIEEIIKQEIKNVTIEPSKNF